MNKEDKQEMSIQEIIGAILSQDDVSGITLIIPKQSILHIEKGEKSR